MARTFGILLFALTSLIALLALPGAAGAADYWTSPGATCGGGNNTDSERGSGQIDAAGRLYLPCSQSTEHGFDNHLAVFDAGGRRIARIDLEFDRNGYNYRATDVAPSPDGRYLYVMRMGDGLVYRFVRQGATGYSYRADSQAEWRLADFPWNGCMKRPRGQFLATDGNGDIYVSHGLWWNSEPVAPGAPACDGLRADTVVKYRPEAAGGRFLSTFGSRGGDTWELGKSRGAWGGVAVTATGDRVFVTDINNSRVQRFDRIHGTDTYAPKLAVGRSGGSVEADWCYEEAERGLSAPYDVAMSPNGELLAINTSCTTGHAWLGVPFGTIEVHRYRQDGGALRGVVRIASDGKRRVHGIAVDRSGNIHLVQAERVGIRPAGFNDSGADAGGGGPLGGSAPVDATAPALNAVGAPATTTARTVTITVDATDAVGVAEMRLRVDGVQQDWRPYAPSFEHTLADRLGDHVVAVQVRDGAGNASGERAVTIRREPVPVVPAPAPAPAPQPVNPAPVVPQPANPAPQQPTGGVPTVAGGGAGAAAAGDTTRPTISSVRIPVQVFRGRAASVTVRATDDRGATRVRFSTGNGAWSKWVPLRARHAVLLPRGAGWKGMLLQVGDAAGNRSTPWFQPVFLAPRGASWYKGTSKADNARLGGGSQHADLSSFDRTTDRISCGAGYDTVLAQPEDVVAGDCERVVRFRMPAW